jgi:RNA polymerase sigma-70 factor (ECF subfamily)
VSQQKQGPDVLLFGDEDTSLFSRHGAAVFAWVRLHTQSREDARDITLEVFKIALEHNNLSGIPEKEQLTWLRRVSHNKIVDRYRRVTRHPQVSLDTVTENVYDDEVNNPEQIALRQETHQQLHQVIKNLSMHQQHLLKLRYGNGLSFAEIAQLFDKNESAVRKMLSRTLTRLRILYNHQEGETSC